MRNLNGELNPFYGKKHTKEAKEKISKSNTGRIPWNKGCKMPSITGENNPAKRPEVREKLRNRIISEETRAKLRLVSKGIVRSEEFKRKVSLSKKGVPNPKGAGEKCNFWKGGTTIEYQKLKNSKECKEFIKTVYYRDNYTCRRCSCVGGKLNVHHIKNFAKYKDLRFIPSNGVTLCQECHRNFHKKYGIKNNNVSQIKEYLIN